MTITQSFTRLSAMVAGAAVAVALFAGAFAAATPAHAASLTSAQVSSIISLLQSFGADAATIANVQASLTGGTPSTPSTPSTTGGSCPALTRDLQVGSTGADVMALQKFLNSDAATMVAASGAGSAGMETSTFGPATKAAVIKLQTKWSVTPAAGYVGAKSRAAIAAACGGSTGTTPTTPTGPGVSVNAGAQPANALAPQGATRVPFTTLTITNNSGMVQSINGITVERNGLGVDANFSGIVLVDTTNNVQLGIAKTLNSNHQAVVGDTFTINPGETKTLTVAGNIATGQSTGGQIVALKVVAVASTGAVSGSLPIMGASHTINSTLSLGSVSTTTSSFDPGATSNRNIGDTNVRISGIRFTASSVEDLKLYSLRWRQTGTASAADISNVMTYVNGTSYPTVVDASGKYYTTTFPGGITIAKGNSVDAYVQADITGSNSASRTVKMDIDRVTDVYFVGQLYGYGVAPSGTWTPWFSGYTVTIQPGTVTLIGKANEVPAGNIAPGVTGQTLGGFATNFAGESVSIQGLTLTVATSSGFTSGPLTNVTIVDSNGAVVAGPVDQAVNASTVVFSDTVTFTTGRKVYTVKGKIPSSTANNATVYLTVDPSNWTNPTGQTSGSTISLTGTASFQLNTMTVKAAALSTTASSQPAAASIVAGIQGAVLGTIQLDASQSGEDVRLSTVPVYALVSSGSLNTYLTGCALWDGTTQLTTGSRVINSVTANAVNNFQLDNTLTITKGTVKSLSVSCNVGSSATGIIQFGVNGGTWSATGVVSGATVSVSAAAGVYSGLQTVGAGSVTVAVDASSPSYALAAGGTTGVTVGTINFHANNEIVTLNKIGLTLTSGTSAQLNNVTIWDGNTQVGSVIFTGNNTVATSTLSAPVTLPKDTDKILTVKADFADIGSSQSGTDGALVKIDPNSSEGSGQSSGNTLRTAATGNVAGVRVYNTYPTLALDTLSSTGIADGKLMHFKVTANAADKVGIGQFKFKVSTTTLTVTNIQLFGFTDSGYSTAISNQGTSGQIGSTVSVAQNGTAFTIAPDLNSVSVSAGTTMYFELRASIAGNVSGASVVTTLVGDTSGTPTTGTTAFASVSGNFIWSPNATTTAATSTGNDWTNGYGVSGLPSSGLFQSRSN